MKLLLGVLVALAGLCAQEVTAEFDPAATDVSFTLGDVLHTVHGSFRLKSGEVRFDPATGKIGGTVVVDATSGDSGSSARDSRMHKKILESQKYPEITFSPDHIEGRFNPQGDSKLQVHGLFSIHGSAHEITVPVETHVAGNQLTVDAQFAIPYVKWGMKNPSTLLLRVSDTVAIHIKAVARISESRVSSRRSSNQNESRAIGRL